ncbi:hypothetical protein IAR50_007275 [Cryptococcus sp. DSM 104548]
MSSITPSNFVPLLPVHHLILDQLIASAPLSALTLCSSVYKRTLLVLYRDIYSSPDVFSGLRHQRGYLRTVGALSNTKTIRVGDFESIDTLYTLYGPNPEEDDYLLGASPSPSQSYPRPYIDLFPNLERIELYSSALLSKYHEYLDELQDGDATLRLDRRLSKQLPNGVKEIVFHLDGDDPFGWAEINLQLFNQAPREAVILLTEAVSKILDSDDGMTSFCSLGENLPTEWYNAERLRVFVRTEEPRELLDDRLLQRYLLTMGKALAWYANQLALDWDLEGWAKAAGQELMVVGFVEIHFPFSQWVLAEMDNERRSEVDALIRDGRLELKEYNEEAVEGLDLMEQKS